MNLHGKKRVFHGSGVIGFDTLDTFLRLMTDDVRAWLPDPVVHVSDGREPCQYSTKIVSIVTWAI